MEIESEWEGECEEERAGEWAGKRDRTGKREQGRRVS